MTSWVLVEDQGKGSLGCIKGYEGRIRNCLRQWFSWGKCLKFSLIDRPKLPPPPLRPYLLFPPSISQQHILVVNLAGVSDPALSDPLTTTDTSSLL
jgi:hypothetical protein